MKLSFFVSGLPKGQPRGRACVRRRKGGGFVGGTYDPGTADDWKACVRSDALKAIENAQPFFIPIFKPGVPVFCAITFVFPRPKHHFGSKGGLKASAPTWHTAKPDRDNLDKATLDALTQAGVWSDDAQVADGGIRKRFAALGEATGARIEIHGLD